jgi:anthranilate synthase/aminodeoxychorismate synthase-like glutamine amidotransferase
VNRHKLLIIDNYDSFTFNLVQLFGQMEQEIEVVRNDAIDVAEIRRRRPEALIISPGPGAPSDSGVCNRAIKELHAELPILGVCLGHQCMGEVFGGQVTRARVPMHGKTSPIIHKGTGLFQGVPSPFRATRYHSLVVRPDSVPDRLQVDATTEEGVIMALKHRQFPVFGIQFHPESIMTEYGDRIASNFLSYCDQKGRSSADARGPK